jgi:hypothetical protein
VHLAGGELQHAHSCVLVPGSQEGGVRAEHALSACSEYTLLLLVITYYIVCIIAVTMMIRAIRANWIISVFTGIRAIRIESVVFGNICVIKDTRDKKCVVGEGDVLWFQGC